MRASKDGDTVGFTMRLKKTTFDRYTILASQANLQEIKQGRIGRVTAQDIMRERLDSLPEGEVLTGSKKGGQ